MNEESGSVKNHYWIATLAISIAASLITALVIQIGGALWWGGKIEADQIRQNNEINDLKVKYTELNEGGTKRLPLIDQRLKALEDEDLSHRKRMIAIEDRLATINPLTALRLETLSSAVSRIDARQDRFSDALDTAYNELQDHMRNPNQPFHNTPLPKHR